MGIQSKGLASVTAELLLKITKSGGEARKMQLGEDKGAKSEDHNLTGKDIPRWAQKALKLSAGIKNLINLHYVDWSFSACYQTSDTGFVVLDIY